MDSEKQEQLKEEYATYTAILQPLLGEAPQLGLKYQSPIPRNGYHYETSASFNIFAGTGQYEGCIFWKDWGLASQAGSRPIHLLQHLYPDKGQKELWDIMADLEKQHDITVPMRRKNRLGVEWAELSHEHLEWWASYGVGRGTLDKFLVKAATKVTAGQHILFPKGARVTPVAFVYLSDPGGTEWQFYCPEPKDFWRKGTFIYGEEQLPFTGDTLVVVSGMKDGLVLHEATGIPFVAFSGESSWKQAEKRVPKYRRRFKHIFTLFDPDPPGREASRVWEEKLGLKPLPFRFLDHKRDIAALGKGYGLSFVRDRFNEALTNRELYTR